MPNSLVGTVDLVVDKHRVDGSRVRLAEVEVGDETGRVSLRARDDQIDLLQQVSDRGAAVVLRNCTLELFQGKHIRLAVTKWGKITPYPDAVASTPVPPSKMNEDRFLSSIDLTVVAMDTSVHHAAQQSSGSSGDMYGADNDITNFASKGGRGNNAGRKQTRQKNPTQGSAPVPSYAGNMPVTYGDVMRYPGGLHGYGYVENTMEAYGGYRPRTSAESMASAHMMMQQQYEMHQRQMHQMYQNRHPAAPADASAMLTGLAPSFDSSGFGRNDVFMTAPQANLFPQVPSERTPTQPSATASTTTSSSASTSGHFPASPKMNPRAATFDPSKGGP